MPSAWSSSVLPHAEQTGSIASESAVLPHSRQVLVTGTWMSSSEAPSTTVPAPTSSNACCIGPWLARCNVPMRTRTRATGRSPARAWTAAMIPSTSPTSCMDRLLEGPQNCQGRAHRPAYIDRIRRYRRMSLAVRASTRPPNASMARIASRTMVTGLPPLSRPWPALQAGRPPPGRQATKGPRRHPARRPRRPSG